MTKITFRVEDDKGNPVEKVRSLSRIKDYIKRDYEGDTGLNIGAFTCEQTADNEITCKNKKHQTMTWHFGGFDGHEVLEPEMLEWE